MSKKARKLRISAVNEAETAKKEMDWLAERFKKEKRKYYGKKMIYTSNYNN